MGESGDSQRLTHLLSSLEIKVLLLKPGLGNILCSVLQSTLKHKFSVLLLAFQKYLIRKLFPIKRQWLMVTLKIHLPLNKPGFCLTCDSFFIELQKALFSFITSSSHQWLQQEFLSRVTEHCRAAATITDTEQQQNSKRLKPQRCWPLFSGSQFASRGCWCSTASTFSSSSLGTASGWGFQSNWAELESM